jgi:hypothetical protein
MLKIIDQETPDHSAGFVISLPKYNRMWGVDYLLLDSKTFNENENITDMFINIWNAYKYKVLDNLHL